jgi:hypothetical protein
MPQEPVVVLHVALTEQVSNLLPGGGVGPLWYRLHRTVLKAMRSSPVVQTSLGLYDFLLKSGLCSNGR